ncbi:MAG: tetratricopeptide repeat protein [Bacteroidetes bacterium]|nr:MAG: tetratricopeptide repeat protein [Bacteroidota bacterium]MBL1143462.1 tetratricopeptide repeat protein [Bacteroidota bacterium]MCB0802667.1 tetratricopeptide repeat protein [Flavobacteriales bacterium]NOG56266.1 tetratricopeptide repeat protein [Bacteroidota bacterium]
MMKRFTLLAMIALFFTTGNAQEKYGADSVKCVQNLSLYRDYYKQKMYDDAYKYWHIVYKICPASSERMYVDGTNLIEYKIRKASTDAAKNAYTDTLLMVYDQRIANFGKEGFVLGRKGTDMLRYMSDQPQKVYDVLAKSIELQGKNSEAGAIVSYMNALVLLEKAGVKTPADVVDAFGKMSDYLAYNITKYNGKPTQEYYIKAQESVESVSNSYLSCDILVEMAKKNYEGNKTNQEWMERTADILDKKGCTDAPIFFTIAKNLHATNPSSVSAEKMGIMSLKTKKYQDAVDFFKQALDMNQDDSKTADYYIELAQAYSSMGSFAAARTNARKAAEIKSGYGLPYIMIGDMIAGSSNCGGDDACAQKAIYWLAVDYYTKAKSVDASVAETANSKIATYKKYFPTKEDCFFGGTKEGDTIEIGCWIGESTKARF